MRQLIAALSLCLATTAGHAELPVFAAVEDLHASASARIASRQFDGLLADADRYLATQERLADGRWKLAILLGGLRRGFKADAHSPHDWAAYEAALTTLAKKRPASPNAWLFVAVLHNSHAWAQRGGGYAGSVTPEAMRAFQHELALSRAVLEAHPMPANPAWYDLQIQVRGAQGDSASALDRLFMAAIRQQPGYQQTWFSRLLYLEPKWGGSLEDMLALIDQGARTPSPTEGHGMMARLLWIASETDYPEMLRLPGIDWETLKASFEDILERYPDDWNSQWFFIQACTRGDRSEARHLLDFIKQPPSATLFRTAGFELDACASWAHGRAPSFTMIDPVTHEPRRVR